MKKEYPSFKLQKRLKGQIIVGYYTQKRHSFSSHSFNSNSLKLCVWDAKPLCTCLSIPYGKLQKWGWLHNTDFQKVHLCYGSESTMCSSIKINHRVSMLEIQKLSLLQNSKNPGITIFGHSTFTGVLDSALYRVSQKKLQMCLSVAPLSGTFNKVLQQAMKA